MEESVLLGVVIGLIVGPIVGLIVGLIVTRGGRHQPTLYGPMCRPGWEERRKRAVEVEGFEPGDPEEAA